MSSVHAGPSSTPKRLALLADSFGSPSKRQRTTGLADVHPSGQLIISPPPTSLPPIPPIPLLYHLAITAHHTAQNHLQQAFIPQSVTCEANAGYPPMTTNDSPRRLFSHDPQAAAKVIGLQVFALDLLRSGLKQGGLSDREKVAFGLEFGLVGIKVLAAGRTVKGKEVERVDMARLEVDVQDVIGDAVSTAKQHTYLRSTYQQLELLQARFAFFQGKYNAGRRITRQGLETTPRTEPAHRYALLLLLLSNVESSSATEPFLLLDQLEAEASTSHHSQIIQLVKIARVRLMFHVRRWDLLPKTLEDLATSIGWSETANTAASGPDQAWRAHLTAHYLIFRALWEGRIGNDKLVKSLLKGMYNLIDEASEQGLMYGLRSQGGVIKLDLPVPGGPAQSLLVQVTPPNIAFLMTFVTTTTSRRDYTGLNSTCKILVHSSAMQEFENVARVEDIWDVNFSPSHGLADVFDLRQQIMVIRAEVMLEQVTALLFRSAFEAAAPLLNKILDHLRTHGLTSRFLPQLCFAHGQYAHLLGVSEAAVWYYEACRGLLEPASELGIHVEVCLLGAEGSLKNVKSDHMLLQRVNALSERCRGSTNAGLVTVGLFLASLTGESHFTSKKHLNNAYNIVSKAGNNVFRCLTFAFTTSPHWYGPTERVLSQLESGRDIARHMGGKDREDGVGQVSLGIWFAYRLKEIHRLEGNVEEHAKSKRSLLAHTARIRQIQSLGERFASILDGPALAPVVQRLGSVQAS